MAIPASVEQEIRDKRVGKDAAAGVNDASASDDVGKRESGDVKLETDPSETGEPFVTKFGPAITTADVLIVPQGCQLLRSWREAHNLHVQLMGLNTSGDDKCREISRQR